MTMIKKYNDFMKGRVNENAMPYETEVNPVVAPPRPREREEMPNVPDLIPTEEDEPAPAKALLDSPMGEEEEPGNVAEVEGGDVFSSNLNKLAALLGPDAKIEGNKVHYGDKTIDYPSETMMFHVDKKKFKTAEEAAEYLGVKSTATEEIGEFEKPIEPMDGPTTDTMEVSDEQEMEDAVKEFESKSYKTSRRFKKFRK